MANSNSDLFTRHSDSVLCCAIDDRPKLAVSGGIDDTAFVWDLDTKHVIFECVGHKESVTAAAFNRNSVYVATGDLNGYIQVRNTRTGIKIFDYDIDEINWILWHSKSEHVLLAGTIKGDFWMWNVNDPAAVKIFNSFGSSCSVAKLLDDGMNIVVGYQDGAIRIFDLKTTQAVHRLEPGAAEIISMDVNFEKSLLTVGCVDSSIRIFTLGILKLVGTLYCKSPPKPVDTYAADSELEADDQEGASVDELEIIDEFTDPDIKKETIQDDDKEDEGEGQGEKERQGVGESEGEGEGKEEGEVERKGEGGEEKAQEGQGEREEAGQEEGEDKDESISEDEGASFDEDSVETVMFSPCGTYLAAANNSGTIIIWDVSSQAKRCEKHTGIGVSRSVWLDNNQYVTACLDGCIRVYDINLNELKHIPAHSDQILDIAARGQLIVTSSEDKTCKVVRL